jgi:hypothetical protein
VEFERLSKLDDQAGQDSRGRALPARVSLLQGLEQIREHLGGQLSAIAELARERSSSSLETERGLLRRIEHLEKECDRLRSEADSRQASTEQLERDRLLLGNAWEQLECEQVKLAAFAQHAKSSTSTVNAGPRLVPRPEAPDRSDPIALAVLQQFDTLRRDVRKESLNGK